MVMPMLANSRSNKEKLRRGMEVALADHLSTKCGSLARSSNAAGMLARGLGEQKSVVSPTDIQ